MTKNLSLWTVYDHPTDYPKHYVARRFDITADGAKPSASIIMSESLEVLRAMLLVDMNLTLLHRHPDDDAKILETWI